MQNDDYLAAVNRICRADLLYKKTHTFPTEKLQIFYGVPGFLGDQIQGSFKAMLCYYFLKCQWLQSKCTQGQIQNVQEIIGLLE